MPWVGALIGVGGALLSSGASEDAADTQAAAAAEAQAGTQARFDKTVELNQPLIDARNGSLAQLVSGTSAGGEFMSPFQYNPQQDPSADFRLQKGLGAVTANRATAGLLGSGSTLKALTEYGQNFANTEYRTDYNNQFNRYQSDLTNRFNRLASVAGLGQTGANNVQTAGTAATAAINEYGLQGANAGAAGTVGQANALTGGLSQLGNWWQNQQGGGGVMGASGNGANAYTPGFGAGGQPVASYWGDS